MKIRYSLLLLTMFVCGMMYAQQGPPTPSTEQIRFISQPPPTGQAGDVYTYTVKAVSSDSTATIYYFLPPPFMNSIQTTPAMKIDSVTGVYTFTPTVKGWYTLGVVARSAKGGMAMQRFSITVSGGNGFVFGKVADISNSGIENVIVELFKAENPVALTSPGGDPGDFQGDGCFVFSGITDKYGMYHIRGIDPGNYKIHAISPSPLYESQWYEGQVRPDSAKIIAVGDSAKQGPNLINFVLRSGILKPAKVSVSGSVKDTLGNPVRGIGEVYFVPADFALNGNASVDDFRQYFSVNAGKSDCKLDGRAAQVIHAYTDSLDGTYTISIQPGSYIAFAKSHGYVTEYYQEQSNLLLATSITVQANTPITNINFTLAPVPSVALGSITGSVLDSSKGVGVPSRIIISRDLWTIVDQSNAQRTYVGDTDSLGVYSVSQLSPGTYFVFALPLGSYAPAYYSNDTANTHWKKASKVTVNGNGVSGITIYVRQLPATASGYTGIAGTVRSTEKAPTGIPGALVYATKNNQVAGYAITNNSGAYSIAGLAPSSYSVTVDNLGSTEPAAATVSVSYNASTFVPVTATSDFSISTTTTDVTVSLSEQPTQFTLSQNFPNPFNPTTTIDYAIQQSGVVTLKVYNLIGQEILTLVNKYQPSGSYRVTFDAQTIASGVYFYRLQSDNNTLMHKMVLLR